MGGLTRPGLFTPPGVDPSTGQAVPPELQYFDSPASRALAFAKQQTSQVQPSTSAETGESVPAPVPNVPKFVQPSFRQAMTDPSTGMTGTINPSETKLGKLVHILAGAAQGALAGWGTGNPGAGAQAAREIPFEEAQHRGQIALQQSEMQPVQTPYGPLPAALAPKLLSPYLQYEGKTQAANIGAASREKAAATGAAGRVQAEQIAKRFIVVPGVGVYDTALTNEKSAPALLPGTSQSITITPELAKEYQLPEEFIGKPMKLTELAGIQRSSVFQNVPVQTASGPVIVNRRTSEATPVTVNGQPAQPASLAGYQEVPNPDNPGETMFVRKTALGGNGQAPKGGTNAAAPPKPVAGKGSATHQAAVAVTKNAISGPIGDEINAFNTALQHANLLETAVRALNNNDPQTLNALKNRFKSEFGATEPLTAQTVAQAYHREITKMLSAKHVTDAEISSAGATLDPNRFTLPQMEAALGAYRALATSKMKMRQEQVERGKKGEANFPQNSPTGQEIHWKVVNGQLVKQ